MELQSTAVDYKDVIKFILANRKNGAFDYPDDVLENVIKYAIYKKHLYITLDGNVITGIIIAYIVDDFNIKVELLICTTKEAFQRFRKMGRQLFGNRKCEYCRFNKDKILTRY